MAGFAEDRSPMSSLHQDMIVEILRKLPDESLARFRFVSKSWHSIITDPRFFRLPYNSQDRLFLYSHDPPQFGMVNCEALTVYGSRIGGAVVNIDLPEITNTDKNFRVWGSCNGLICFDSNYGGNIYLLNPSTKDFKLLPEHRKLDDWKVVSFGFAYDKSIDDYKVIGVLHSGSTSRTETDVLTLKTNTWKRSRNLDLSFKAVGQSDGILLNGALHWAVFHGNYYTDDHTSEQLVALNLEEEKFHELPRLELDRGFGSRLGVLGGCLCLCSRVRDEGTTDVWLMKRYGVRESWTKLMSLQSEIFMYRKLWSFKPLCFSKDGRSIIAHVNGTMLARTGIKSKISSFLKSCLDACAYT